MAFDEIQFPPDISYGSRGGPGHRTDIITVDSGAEQRTARWSSALRQYNASYGIKSPLQLNTLITFLLARKGAQYGFRYKDWMDFTSATDHRSTPTFTNQEIGVGDGTTTQFQLVKKYTSGRTITRNITKPVTSTTVVAKDGVQATTGWTVDTTTGIVTFSVAPTADVVVTAGFEFDVPVRFGQDVDGLLEATWEDFGSGSFANGLTLIEIQDGLAVYDDVFMGGALEETLYANKQLSLAEGRVQVFNADTAHNLILPNKTNVQTGGPILYLFNASAFTLTVKDGATTVGTLATGTARELILGLDSGGSKAWYLI